MARGSDLHWLKSTVVKFPSVTNINRKSKAQARVVYLDDKGGSSCRWFPVARMVHEAEMANDGGICLQSYAFLLYTRIKNRVSLGHVSLLGSNSAFSLDLGLGSYNSPPLL